MKKETGPYIYVQLEHHINALQLMGVVIERVLKRKSFLNFKQMTKEIKIKIIENFKERQFKTLQFF